MYAWPIDPPLYTVLVAALVGYAVVGRGTSVTWRQRGYFLIGLLVLWAALATPLETLGRRYLVSAEMAQHMLLMAIAPPLLLLGLSQATARRLLLLPGLREVTQPIVSLVIYATLMIVWHLPALYDWALGNDVGYAVERLSFVVGGLVYWWCLIRATSAEGKWSLSDPQKLVLLFFGTIPMLAVALPLQFAPYPFYTPYVHAPRVDRFLTPVIDQTVAGAVMMTIDMSVMATDGLVVFFRWFGRQVAEDLRRAEDPLGVMDDPEQEAALERYLREHP